MKIVCEQPVKALYKFKELACGEVFRDMYSDSIENICMKIEDTVEGKNAVYLTSGTLNCVPDDLGVELVSCCLKVE